MERNAHYAGVGLMAVALFMGLVVFIVWLAHFQFTRDYDIYDVQFYGPVRGLSEGGEVHFNGIKVGEVTALKLDQDNPNRVIARVRLTSSVPVKTDSRAQLEPQGITGVNYIQISAGSPRSPLLKDQPRKTEVPVILSQPSPISELLEGGYTVVAEATMALKRVNRVLSDDNIKNFGATMHDVREIAAEARAHKQAIAEAEIALKKAGDAAEEFQALAKSGRVLMDGDARKAIQSINKAAVQIDVAARQIDDTVGKVGDPAADFASTGLPQLTAAVASLQEAADSLSQLVREARASPQGLITKAPAKEIEVKP